MTTPKAALVPTAIKERTNIDLSFPHVTTSDFMQFNCACKRVLSPTQTYNVSHSEFTRLQPMDVPTFGDAQIINRAFFVPFRTVMPSWNDYITDSVHNFPNGDVDHVPCNVFFKNSSLIALFMNPIYASETYIETWDGDRAQVENYDIVFKAFNTDDNELTCVNLNRKGKLALKILHQLGYGINVDERGENDSYSAMSLLCLVKIYMDWYYPQAYVQDERAQIIMSYFTRDSLDELELTQNDLYNIFEVISYCNYDSDYFVSAWDNPISPNSGAYSATSFVDVTSEDIGFNVVNQNAVGTPEINASASISQYSLDALKAITDYLRRHQIAGARCLDRYLSRFGIVLNSDKLLRSHYLTDYSNYIQFGDVTSTASTDASSLGSYAGKGVGICNGDVSFTPDEYGMFIIVSTIIPKIGYYQGIDRENLYMTKLDYPTPEFDGLSVQAIGLNEVYCPLNVVDNGLYSNNIAYPMNYDEHVFGFVPKYAEAKIANAKLTGDFRFGSVNTGASSWTLFRDLSYTIGQGNLVHDVNFTRGIDAGQYDRIFQYTNTDVDHFTVIHQFKIQSSYPGSSLYDNYEFEDEDKAKKVKVDINGVKAN